MRPEVLVRVPFPKESIALLEEDFAVHYAPTPDELATALGEVGPQVRAVVTNGSIGLKGEHIRAMPKLEIILTVGIGFEWVDLQAAGEAGIVVANNVGTNSFSVAEQAMALLLAIMRDVCAADDAVRSGGWANARQPRPLIYQKRVGILGLGEVGDGDRQARRRLRCEHRLPQSPSPRRRLLRLLRLAARAGGRLRHPRRLLPGRPGDARSRQPRHPGCARPLRLPDQCRPWVRRRHGCAGPGAARAPDRRSGPGRLARRAGNAGSADQGAEPRAEPAYRRPLAGIRRGGEEPDLAEPQGAFRRRTGEASRELTAPGASRFGLERRMAVVLGEGDYRYEVHRGWGTLPDGWSFREVAAVGVDAADRVYVFNRGEHPMIVFDRDGGFVALLGRGRVPPPARRAHGARTRRSSAPMTATTPCANARSKGKVLLQLGVPGKPAPFMSRKPFHRCTHTALSPNGDIYVSDGYGNARVHKYSPDGKHLLSWGEPGTAPGQFNLAHNICCDADGWVYVADRESHRVQMFDGNGTIRDAVEQPAPPERASACRPASCPICYIGEGGPTMSVNRKTPESRPARQHRLQQGRAARAARRAACRQRARPIHLAARHRRRLAGQHLRRRGLAHRMAAALPRRARARPAPFPHQADQGPIVQGDARHGESGGGHRRGHGPIRCRS